MNKSVYSTCFSDIYSVGLSTDSFAMKVKDTSSDYVSLASKNGLGIYLSKIYFCPEKKLETELFYNQVFINWDTSEYSMNEDTDIMSVGSKLRYFYKPKWDILVDAYLREDLKYNLDSYGYYLDNDRYFNLKLSGGFRYLYSNKKNNSVALILKAGILKPISQNEEMGTIYEVGGEYFLKMTKNYSLRFLANYSHYEQEANDVDHEGSQFKVSVDYFFIY